MQSSSQTDYYADNEEYAAFLDSWDDGCYEKYSDALNPLRPWKSAPAQVPNTPDQPLRVLDVGCGVGQVLERLESFNASATTVPLEAYGVDVSEPNIRRAQNRGLKLAQLYDGERLPFEDGYFSSIGALNVLEHVSEPEAFLQELTRVLRPGGRMIISSPNFLRVIGWNDYHPRMRGIANKALNLRSLLQIWRSGRNSTPSPFERMEPIIKEPFSPDDDAIVATNALQIRLWMQSIGFQIVDTSCADRYCPALVDRLANLGFWKYGMLNAFVMGIRRKK